MRVMRWIGAALCFLTGVLAGQLGAAAEKERTAQCEAFLAFFLYIKNQVGFFLTPTKQIYRSFSHPVLEKIGFLKALQSHDGDTIYFGVWNTTLESCRGRLRLSETQYEIVRAFGACIGKSHEALQLTSFDYYLKLMTAETEKQRAEMKKNQKLCRTLGFSIGAAVAILLL